MRARRGTPASRGTLPAARPNATGSQQQYRISWTDKSAAKTTMVKTHQWSGPISGQDMAADKGGRDESLRERFGRWSVGAGRWKWDEPGRRALDYDNHGPIDRGVRGCHRV